MLTGRRSLKQMIGKRRRFLPNHRSLLWTPIQNHSKFGEKINSGYVCEKLVSEESEIEVSTSDLVICPVCGNTIRGTDFLINLHLDACLTRGTKGTKRKLTQPTLLQLDFCSISKDQNQCGGMESLGTNVVHDIPKKNIKKNNICTLTHSDSLQENNDDLHGIFKESDKPTHFYSSPGSSSNEKPIVDVVNISGVFLQSFIVGRKFSNVEELSLGDTISLLRDPNNVKDPNAIKVISEDSRCSIMLGFLPRDLARYLSPLILMCDLIFEGYVTSVPSDSQDVVPIQIVCHKTSSFDEKYVSLWKNVLCVVESMKTNPPSTTKYLQNFCLLIEELQRNNSHLLTDAEKIFLDSFATLSVDSQRLFVRLYTRKGPWFQIAKISYPEIRDSQAAFKELLTTGFISSFDSTSVLYYEDLESVLNVHTISELQEILFNNKKCTRKQDLIASIISSYHDGKSSFVQKMFLEKASACIQISPTAESIFWRAQRLFFLNGEQDLSSFLLVDMGLIKFPDYNCLITKPIFAARSELLDFEEAIEVAQILDESLDQNNNEVALRCIEMSDSIISKASGNTAQSSAIFFSCLSASRVYSNVVLLGISFLEREHRYREAVVFLRHLLANYACSRRRGYWTLRLSVDLEHLNCVNESLSAAEDGLSDSWIRAGSKVALQSRVLRLGKPPRRWKIPKFSKVVNQEITEVKIQGRPLNCKTGKKSRFYGEDGNQCGVEQLALQYYAREGGWQGVHSESGIWLTIFALLMWDVLFADVPDVFRNQFQTCPLDLGTDCFYVTRKSLIEEQLKRIEEDDMGEEVTITSWESHVGTACRGVDWDRHSLSSIRAAVACIGGRCIASICRHLAQDYRSWSSGMPDLLLWRFNECSHRGEAKLVEVKGGRDRLSEQQRAWLLFLMDCGFTVEVCKVTPSDKTST